MILLRSACALFAVCSIGCATSRYDAANLPVELQAPLVENPQTVDLSNLAMATTSDDLIARGDVLEVNIFDGLKSPDPLLVRIDNDGFGELPYIGTIPLAGSDMETAESRIKAAYVNGRIYRPPHPHVTVVRRRQQKNQVLVIGAVKEPGKYELPRRSSDLLSAIYAAGGLAEDAGPEVEIRYPGGLDNDPRQSAPVAGGSPGGLSMTGHSLQPDSSARPRSIQVDLVSAAKSGTKGYYIDDGGIVVVEKRDPMPVKVMGLVKQPGIYDFPVTKEIRVLDAISMAKGVSTNLADKIYVIRRLPQFDGPKVIQVSLAAAKTDGRSNLRLAPGDVVTVEQTFATVVLDTLKIIRFGIGASLGALF